jgi:hypothetical protein
MQYLDFGDNQFSGVLPSELSQLTELRLLALDRNQFEGEMISLKEMTLLSICYLSYNNGLSGDVGEFLGSSMNLYYLSLSGNQFTGCILESHFKASEVTFLDFDNNEIECIGDFSAFVESGSLMRISSSNNRIPFEFLEHNRGTPDFEYTPQKQLLEASSHVLKAGDSLVIHSGSGGLYTTYQWFRDNQEIPGAITRPIHCRAFKSIPSTCLDIRPHLLTLSAGPCTRILPPGPFSPAVAAWLA